MRKKSMYAMDNTKGAKEIVHAGEAYFFCHEFKKLATWTWQGA